MKLESLYNSEMQGIDPLFDHFAWTDPWAYANWCAQTYFFVSHSTRLLSLVAAYTKIEDPSGIHHRFLKHSVEESGHEKVILRDLQSINYKIENFQELSETKNFYQPQYYLIQHVQPSSFLGYILFLEGLAVQQADRLSQIITKTYGSKAATFINLHGGEDPSHLKKAFELIATLPASEVEIIKENLSRSCATYTTILKQISFLSQKKKEAA